MTNHYVLLKNLEAFINSVPIDPKLPNCKDWEKTRAEMKKALKDTYKILVKQGFPEPLRLCGKIPLKQVFPAPLRYCGKILEKSVQAQFEPVRKKS